MVADKREYRLMNKHDRMVTCIRADFEDTVPTSYIHQGIEYTMGQVSGSSMWIVWFEEK